LELIDPETAKHGVQRLRVMPGSAKEAKSMAGVEHPKDDGRSLLLGVVVCAGVVFVLGCCVLPSLVFRPAVDVNTFYPEKGLTMDEMRARYGRPSEAYTEPDGTARWYYYTDCFGLGWGSVGVEFDASGRVVGDFIH
jgi:hypothetical protein